MTREQILELAQEGFWLDKLDKEYKLFHDLDGKHAREYLESKGFTVVRNGDADTHGYALTSEGVYLSTNGYCGLKK